MKKKIALTTNKKRPREDNITENHTQDEQAITAVTILSSLNNNYSSLINIEKTDDTNINSSLTTLDINIEILSKKLKKYNITLPSNYKQLISMSKSEDFLFKRIQDTNNKIETIFDYLANEINDLQNAFECILANKNTESNKELCLMCIEHKDYLKLKNIITHMKLDGFSLKVLKGFDNNNELLERIKNASINDKNYDFTNELSMAFGKRKTVVNVFARIPTETVDTLVKELALVINSIVPGQVLKETTTPIIFSNYDAQKSTSPLTIGKEIKGVNINKPQAFKPTITNEQQCSQSNINNDLSQAALIPTGFINFIKENTIRYETKDHNINKPQVQYPIEINTSNDHATIPTGFKYPSFLAYSKEMANNISLQKQATNEPIELTPMQRYAASIANDKF